MIEKTKYSDSHREALDKVKKCFAPVSEDIRQLLKLIPSLLHSDSKSAQQILVHVLSQPGKMLRSSVFLLLCRLLQYEGKHKLQIAAATEFVHNASLLHDDVVDSSTQRRNKPTAHTIWGDESAVLVGDLIYARASELMAATGKLAIVNAFASAIRQMSEGELLQLENIGNYSIEESTYFKIIRSKTAALMVAACQSAGYLKEVDDHQINELQNFGLNIGLAFQLVDDALDMMGENIGKKNFTDLKQGKMTYPFLVLRSAASSDETKRLQQLVDTQSTHSFEDIHFVSTLAKKYEVSKKTLQKAYDFTELATKNLNLLFPYESLEKKRLLELIEHMVYRSF